MFAIESIVAPVLIGAQAIEITPVSLPVSSVKHVASAGRRIYMTASLPTAAQFVRTFGVAQPLVVRPGGKSGDAQRLFVFAPGDTDADLDPRQNASRRCWVRSSG